MDEPVVGVVGDDVSGAVANAGAEPLYEAPTAIRDAGPTTVVATGASALSRLVDAGLSCPVVPVDVPRLRAVPREAVTDAVTALIDGRYETASVPTLVAKSPLDETRALFDVMLVASEPARISEYTIRSHGDRVATLRADGIVAATPSGSSGYARRAGGSVIATELNAATVVPVAPFSTDAGHWVVPIDELTLTIERDETAVELLVDDRTVGKLKAGGSVRLTAGRPLTVALVASSAGRFA